MATSQINSNEKWTLTHILKDTILHVCEVNAVYHGKLEIDGIICITGQSEGEQIVVKVHEQICPEKKNVPDVLEPHDMGSYLNKRPLDWMTPGNLKRRRLMQKYSVFSPIQKQNGNKDMNFRKPADSMDRKEIPYDSFQLDDRFGKVNLRKSPAPNPPFQMLGSMGEASPHPSGYTSNKPECKICGYVFDSFTVLCEHNEAAHSAVTCRYCYKTFTSRSNLERHSRLHTGHKPYVCSICGKAFSRKDHLSNHATKHAFKCGTCSKRFPDKKGLVTHYSTDHNALLTNICAFCNKGFSCSETYEDHVKIHPQYMQETDASYHYRSTNEGSMTETSNSPLDLATKKYNCNFCSFSSNDSLVYTKHNLLHSEVKPSYRCGACRKVFYDPLVYTDHLACHDDGQQIFECCLCLQSFCSLSELRQHEMTHVLEERENADNFLTCTKCFKLFAPASHATSSEGMYIGEVDHSLCPRCYEECRKSNSEQKTSRKSPTEKETETNVRENKRKQKVPKSLKSAVSYSEEDLEMVDAEEIDLVSNGDNYRSLTKSGSPKYASHESQNTPIKAENLSQGVEDCSGKASLSEKSNALYEALQVSRSPGHSHESMSSTFASSPSSISNSQSTAAHTPLPDNTSRANLEIPMGPYPCSLCSNVSNAFQDLEMHCFSEHNRSPCMFCSKTFAQKANRDRHVCLHTGEKPYACPECNEKFSRGDKLKIHRIRAHKVQFPSYGSKSKDSAMLDMIGHVGGVSSSLAGMAENQSSIYSSSVTADLSLQNLQNVSGSGSVSSNSGLSYASGKLHVHSGCQESRRDDSDLESKEDSELC